MVPYYGSQFPSDSEELTRHYFWSAFWTLAKKYNDIFNLSVSTGFESGLNDELEWVSLAFSIYL